MLSGQLDSVVLLTNHAIDMPSKIPVAGAQMRLLLCSNRPEPSAWEWVRAFLTQSLQQITIHNAHVNHNRCGGQAGGVQAGRDDGFPSGLGLPVLRALFNPF